MTAFVPGPEPATVLSPITSRQGRVRVWAAERGAALDGCCPGSGCGYRSLAQWAGPMPGFWCGFPCWLAGHVGGEGFPCSDTAVGVWAWRLVMLVLWGCRHLRLARCRQWQGVSLWLACDPHLAH